VYRIQAKGAKPQAVADVSKLSSAQLVALLSSSNEWFARKARRVLADRRDCSGIEPLHHLALEGEDDHASLEALWALYVSGGFDDAFAQRALAHRNPDIRRWAVRLLGDEEHVSPSIAARLIDLAAKDADVTVRSQLASTAKRLPAADSLPIVRNLLRRDQDAQDTHVPLLLWWAVEHHALTSREPILDLFTSPAMWNSALARDVVLTRLVRRYGAEGNESGLTACARLLRSAPSAEAKRRLVANLDQGLSEGPSGSTPMAPPALTAELVTLWSD